MFVSYPALYAINEHADSLDISKVVQEGGTTKDAWIAKHFIRDFSIRSGNDNARAAVAMFKRIESRCAPDSNLLVLTAIKSGQQSLVDLCTYEFKKLAPCLPAMAAGGAAGEWEVLKGMCQKGFKQRLLQPVMGYQPDRTLLPTYVERLRYELSVLQSMGFSNYFLLVAEIVTWAKDNGDRKSVV